MTLMARDPLSGAKVANAILIGLIDPSSGVQDTADQMAEKLGASMLLRIFTNVVVKGGIRWKSQIIPWELLEEVADIDGLCADAAKYLGAASRWDDSAIAWAYRRDPKRTIVKFLRHLCELEAAPSQEVVADFVRTLRPTKCVG